MASTKMNSLDSQILWKISTKIPNSSSLSIQPKPKRHPPTSPLSRSQNPKKPTPKTTEIQLQEDGPSNVKFQTMRSCKLGISRFPDFEYNAEGGKGAATATKNTKGISVFFDIETLYIPPLTAATTRFLGFPLPPFLKIEIRPEVFQGTIEEETGKVELEFRARFWFSMGSIYRAPPLIVETVLTSEEARGVVRSGKGERLDEEGKCRLVGLATVDPINDIFMNTFLGLPTECLADLNATISLSASTS